jgi:hypothetical protein
VARQKNPVLKDAKEVKKFCVVKWRISMHSKIFATGHLAIKYILHHQKER